MMHVPDVVQESTHGFPAKTFHETPKKKRVAQTRWVPTTYYKWSSGAPLNGIFQWVTGAISPL